MPLTPLKFRQDGTFTIVQATDLHLENMEPADHQTLKLLGEVLDAERPDLVAFTGDFVSGYAAKRPLETATAVVQVAEQRKLPWAAVFGNHDDESSALRSQLMTHLQTFDHNLSVPGPRDIGGVGNYVLRLASAGGPGLAAALYFLDSGAYAPKPLEGYGWIQPAQVHWYLEQARALEAEYRLAGGTAARLPALGFFHIPLPEYMEVWSTRKCRGVRYEEVCAPKVNSGFFAAMLEAGDIMGTFVGHDHINDFDGDLHGIRLCYGRGGGFNAYGKPGFLHGARVIRLREGERSFTTWIRLEDGTVITEQPFHAAAGPVLSPSSG